MKTYMKRMRRVGQRLATNAVQLFGMAWPRARPNRLDDKNAPPWPKSVELTDFRGLTRSAKTVTDLIQIYLGSSSYVDLSAATKNSYKLYLGRIGDKFGALPISAFDERGARRVIRQWRDDVLSSRPRTADATIGVFRVLLNFAANEEYIDRNPAAGLGRVHTKTRRDVIWSDAQIDAFVSNAPKHLARALLLALWTGQRQGDLLSLEWSSYDGEYIRLQQRKAGRGSSGRRVKILVSKELRNVLAEIEAEQIARAQDTPFGKGVPRPSVVLTTGRGIPWRLGFKAAWRKAVADAGISGVTFHDLRGTFITLSHRAGATIREIAEASGHDEKDCERVIRQHYLASGAEQAILRLESSKQFTPPGWALASAVGTSKLENPSRFTGPRRARVLTSSSHLSDKL